MNLIEMTDRIVCIGGMHVINRSVYNNYQRKKSFLAKIKKKFVHHVVAYELFALQLHPGTINDEPIVARRYVDVNYRR